MSIIKAFLFPHPPLAVPTVGRGEERTISATLQAYEIAADKIAQLAVDTLVFITPHGSVYQDYFHISPGNGAEGDLARFGAASTRFAKEYDVELAQSIIAECARASLPAGFEGEQDPTLDHGVTVPMYFIDQSFADYRMIRIAQSGLSPADHYRLGQCIAAAAQAVGRKVVLAASGDLSHKLPGSHYGTVPQGRELDRALTGILASGDLCELFTIDERLRAEGAECGFNSIMVLAGTLDGYAIDSELLSYEGPFGVGYAVASFTPTRPDASRKCLTDLEKGCLMGETDRPRYEDPYQALAQQSLEHRLATGHRLAVPDDLDPELLEKQAGVFVSLHKHGELRGCIGTIAPTTDSIAHEIIQNAVSAGLSDTRFAPVAPSELADLDYKVDILSQPEPISSPDQLDVKRFGVIVSSGPRRGLLLPNLEGVDTVDQQIAIARQKAGIAPGTPLSLERFEVIRHE
ncbi:MAG: AmmeMemoRadiSam system protein A [Actinomycetia bacterium]|nr:AmmeMemoRadiSam system protein A [Actinomycetes bacterium]